ncbi:MAG: ABC transporter permease [Pseudomonadota bacterium]
MTRRLGRRGIVWPAAALVLAFLYLPIGVMIAFSLNAGGTVGLPWTGFTMDWYAEVFQDRALMGSLWNSVKVSLGVVVIAVCLGLPAAIALDRFEFPFKGTFRRIVLLPIVLPGVITGVSLLGFYLVVNVRLSLVTLTIALGTALMCVIVTEVFARLQQVGQSQAEAAYDMGATELEVFRKVTLPSISSALLGGILITFSIAMDELAVTYLLIGRENTLPMQIWSMLRRDVSPEINAIATITILISLVLVTIGILLSRGRTLVRD